MPYNHNYVIDRLIGFFNEVELPGKRRMASYMLVVLGFTTQQRKGLGRRRVAENESACQGRLKSNGIRSVHAFCPRKNSRGEKEFEMSRGPDLAPECTRVSRMAVACIEPPCARSHAPKQRGKIPSDEWLAGKIAGSTLARARRIIHGCACTAMDEASSCRSAVYAQERGRLRRRCSAYLHPHCAVQIKEHN